MVGPMARPKPQPPKESFEELFAAFRDPILANPAAAAAFQSSPNPERLLRLVVALIYSTGFNDATRFVLDRNREVLHRTVERKVTDGTALLAVLMNEEENLVGRLERFELPGIVTKADLDSIQPLLDSMMAEYQKRAEAAAGASKEPDDGPVH